MKLRQENCPFMAPEVQYLSDKITKEEIEPKEDKANSVVQVLSK